MYLQWLCKVFLARCFSRCVCFMLNLVTFSLPDGSRETASRTYTHSRLISCTRDSSVVLERLALSIWSSSVYTPFVGNPRVYPLCDPGPALSENLTSTGLSYNSGISHLTRNEVSLKGRQRSDHRDVSPSLFALFTLVGLVDILPLIPCRFMDLLVV